MSSRARNCLTASSQLTSESSLSSGSFNISTFQQTELWSGLGEIVAYPLFEFENQFSFLYWSNCEVACGPILCWTHHINTSIINKITRTIRNITICHRTLHLNSLRSHVSSDLSLRYHPPSLSDWIELKGSPQDCWATVIVQDEEKAVDWVPDDIMKLLPAHLQAYLSVWTEKIGRLQGHGVILIDGDWEVAVVWLLRGSNE